MLCELAPLLGRLAFCTVNWVIERDMDNKGLLPKNLNRIIPFKSYSEQYDYTFALHAVCPKDKELGKLNGPLPKKLSNMLNWIICV